MKVCHLTSVHKSNDVRIFEKECVSLAKNGFDVTLIAVNCDEGIFDGVKVISVNYTPKNRFERMIKTVNKVYDAALKIDADIYHFHDPELLRIGLKLQKRHNKKVVYDSHEDLPRQILDKTWINTMIRKFVSQILERYENRIARKLSGVIAATPHIESRFIAINKNTINVNNYPILEKFIVNTTWADRKQEICYVGGIFNSRGAEELVDAMENVNARLNLAGNYSPESLRDILIAKKGWEKVNEFGFVGREKIVSILGQSKVGIVTLHPTKAYLDSLPIKMFEYMAVGLPVVASDFPLWKSIIQKQNCGICVDPENPEKISEAINHILGNDALAEQMGENGKSAVNNYYNWEKESQKLIRFYKEL